jgi:hypothetical protein
MHAHSAAAKAARLLELDLRTVPADENHALRADVLDLTDACAVVATIGTTSSAAIDPIPAIAERCAAAGVWLHADAAYAGSAAKKPISGISRNHVACGDRLRPAQNRWKPRQASFSVLRALPALVAQVAPMARRAPPIT